MGKCVYSREWPKQYSWMKKTNSKHKAHCRPCNKDISVAQMGESALLSQAKGEWHKKQEKLMSRTFVNFFVEGETKVKTKNCNHNLMLMV